MATWGTFFLVSLVSVVLLYLVGFLVLKGFNFPTLFSLAAAPVVSTLCFEALAIVYDKAHIFATGMNLFLPALIFGVLVFGIGAFRTKLARRSAKKTSDVLACEKFEPSLAFLYVALGLIVGFFVLLRPLGNPECFNETYDTLTHLGLIRSFVDSGNFSTLSASIYRDLGAAGSFYPAGWHLFAAAISSIMNVSNVFSTNVMNYVCCCIVYPLSCLCLLKTIFKDQKNILIAGAIATLAFITFPWFFVVYGVLESNLFGFVLVPVMLVAVMRLFSSGALRADRVRYLVFAFASVAFCFVAQPNAFFAVMLFGIFYLAGRIWQITSETGSRPLAPLKRLAVMLGFFMLMALLWYVCYKMPFLREVTQFIWPPASSKAQTLVNALLFSNSWSPVSIAVSILVIFGLVFIFKKRQYGWVALALVAATLVYWISAGFEGRIDQFVSGFWYTDWRRTAALQAIIAVPVAALGIAYLLELLPQSLKSNNIKKALLGLVLLIVLFFPNFTLRGICEIQTPFGYLKDMVNEFYLQGQTDEEIIFSEDELEFAEQVKQIVGNDIVINSPYDGSLFAYQVNGIRTVFRNPDTPDGRYQSSELLRENLYDFANDEDVAQELDRTGAQYLMLLDVGKEPFTKDWPAYYPERWDGIACVDENTPGFELILSEGDMRLYKIEKSENDRTD